MSERILASVPLKQGMPVAIDAVGNIRPDTRAPGEDYVGVVMNKPDVDGFSLIAVDLKMQPRAGGPTIQAGPNSAPMPVERAKRSKKEQIEIIRGRGWIGRPVANLKALDEVVGPIEDRTTMPPKQLLADGEKATILTITQLLPNDARLMVRARSEKDDRYFKLLVAAGAHLRVVIKSKDEIDLVDDVPPNKIVNYGAGPITWDDLMYKKVQVGDTVEIGPPEAAFSGTRGKITGFNARVNLNVEVDRTGHNKAGLQLGSAWELFLNKGALYRMSK